MVDVLLTLLAEEAVWEAQLAGALLRVSATVVREQRVIPSGHRGHRTVVYELRAETHHVLDAGHKRLDGILYRPEEVCEALEGSEWELAHGDGHEDGEEEDKRVEPHDGGCALGEHRGGTARGFWGWRQHWVGGWRPALAPPPVQRGRAGAGRPSGKPWAVEAQIITSDAKPR